MRLVGRSFWEARQAISEGCFSGAIERIAGKIQELFRSNFAYSLLAFAICFVTVGTGGLLIVCLFPLIGMLSLTVQRLLADAFFISYSDLGLHIITGLRQIFCLLEPFDQALSISQSTEGLSLNKLTPTYANASSSQLQPMGTRTLVQRSGSAMSWWHM